jgi:apolipoprotein D and lipocalin family protein
MGGGGSTMNQLQAMTTPMNIDKFMGVWYVQASIPTIFEKNAYNSMEIYSKTTKGENYDININFSFNKKSFDGPHTEMPQKGWVFNKETAAEWRVSPVIKGFTVPYKAPYIICDVEDGPTEYASTIIGYPDRSYLWIMARKPVLPTSEYDKLIAKAVALGYDKEKILKSPQQELKDRPSNVDPKNQDSQANGHR